MRVTLQCRSQGPLSIIPKSRASCPGGSYSIRHIGRNSPPFTSGIAPLMKPADADVRNSTAAATSSGWPSRPTGIWQALPDLQVRRRAGASLSESDRGRSYSLSQCRHHPRWDHLRSIRTKIPGSTASAVVRTTNSVSCTAAMMCSTAAMTKDEVRAFVAAMIEAESNIQAIGTVGHVLAEPVDPDQGEAYARIELVSEAFGEPTSGGDPREARHRPRVITASGSDPVDRVYPTAHRGAGMPPCISEGKPTACGGLAQ